MCQLAYGFKIKLLNGKAHLEMGFLLYGGIDFDPVIKMYVWLSSCD
jgi:hypothetical protein